MEPTVLIVGAGVTGLALAYRLQRSGVAVHLVDAASRVGGVVQSERTPEGYLIERGPNSFTSGDDMMALLEEIGIGSRALKAPLHDFDRFVTGRRDVRLHKVPTGPLALAKSDILTVGEKLKILSGLLIAKGRVEGDLSIGEYFRPRIGDGPVDALLKPFLSGIYAADGDRVSMEATFGKLHAGARESGGLLGALFAMRRNAPKRPKGPKSPRALVSFPDGLEEFPKKLSAAFLESGGTLTLSAELRIDATSADGISCEINGAQRKFARLVLAVPAPEAAPLLAAVDPEAARWLSSIEYARLTVVHAGLPEAALRNRRPGFGFLNATFPEANPPHCLGMIWNDRIFAGRAPRDKRLFTIFVGGEKEPAKNDWSDEQLRSAISEDLSRLYNDGRRVEPEFFSVTRWAQALPIFRVGHCDRQRAALSTLPAGIMLTGNYLGGVSMPDRVKQANLLAAAIISEISGKQ